MIRRGWSTAAYLGVAALLALVVWQSSVHLAPAEAGLAPRIAMAHGDRVLGPWLYWDAQAYADISANGYTKADRATFEHGGEPRVAFFPGYPLAARVVATFTGDTPTSLMVVTFASGVALSVLLPRWFRRHATSERGARLAFLAVLAFPWAYFLVATGYSDALFLLGVVGAFVLVEEDHPVAAGVVGALASSTRIVGVAVVIGLTLRILERRGALELRWPPRIVRGRVRARDLGVLVSAVGVVGYVGFCWSRYGDPFAFSTAQRGWGSPRGVGTWIKRPLIDMVLHLPDPWFVMRLVLQGFVGLTFCLAIPVVWRRFGPAYGIYTLIVVALPMIGASAFQSMGRQVLAAFPVFAVLGDELAARSRRSSWMYLATSAAVLLVWASFWGRGYWMG